MRFEIPSVVVSDGFLAIGPSINGGKLPPRCTSWGPRRGTVGRDRGHGVQHLVHPRGHRGGDRTACRLPALAGSLVGNAGRPEATSPDGVHPFREPPRPIHASTPCFSAAMSRSSSEGIRLT